MESELTRFWTISYKWSMKQYKDAVRIASVNCQAKIICYSYHLLCHLLAKKSFCWNTNNYHLLLKAYTISFFGWTLFKIYTGWIWKRNAVNCKKITKRNIQNAKQKSHIDNSTILYISLCMFLLFCKRLLKVLRWHKCFYSSLLFFFNVFHESLNTTSVRRILYCWFPW